jgi:uncharacterized protein
MILEGVVSNVAAFGAFVDVGVHQDGLIHISAMSDRYVADPRDVVKPGDIVTVKVLSVDLDRKRIALSLRLDDDPATGGRSGRDERRGQGRQGGRRGQGDQGGQGGQGRQGGQGGGDRASGQGRRGGGGGRRDGGSGADTAMADALRRAGLV